MLKNLLLGAALLLPATAFPAHSGVTLSPDKSMTYFRGTPQKQTLPNWKPPAKKYKIFDTLGKGDAYDTGGGWTICNSESETGAQQWFAFAITPKKDTKITEIVEAVSYIAGTDSVTIALLADKGGVPGAVLQQKTVKHLEMFGDCCGVAVDRLKTGVPVKAGTTYWIGALLPKKNQSTTYDVWNSSSKNTGSGEAASYDGSWHPGSAPYTAFAVYGD